MNREMELEEIKIRLLKNMEERNELILKVAALGYEGEIKREWFHDDKYRYELDTHLTLADSFVIDLPGAGTAYKRMAE